MRYGEFWQVGNVKVSSGKVRSVALRTGRWGIVRSGEVWLVWKGLLRCGPVGIGTAGMESWGKFRSVKVRHGLLGQDLSERR